MSLKEKAETSYSICEKASLTCEVCKPQNKCGSGNCPLVNVLWVRLEDAEQEIAKLKQEYLANIMEEDRRQRLRIQELKKEYQKLKQKLLNIISECCACDIQLLNRKLEELLKEVDSNGT